MLRLNNVTKTFYPGTVNQRTALDKINLTLGPGEFVTIIGGNGAGKSTLMNGISGLFWLDNGEILLDGQNITYQKEYRRACQIGRLFQDPLRGSAPNMTIAENLALAYLRGTKRRLAFGIRREDRDFFRQQLQRLNLGLEDRLDAKMGLLSGGQRQAVTLLMATVVPPKLLMLDEHTAALDPATADQVLQLTNEIVAKDSITTMMVTHNISSALAMGNRTIMMNQGKIILDLSGQQRQQMTVDRLLQLFREKSNRDLDNDRMLLS